MQKAAERHPGAAHTYRIALEQELELIEQSLDPEGHPPPPLRRLLERMVPPPRVQLSDAARQELMRQRDEVKANLAWAKDREGLLGRVFG